MELRSSGLAASAFTQRVTLMAQISLCVCVCVCLRQGFSVALEPVLELALVGQAGLKLTEICLPLPPDCWD